MIRGVANIMLSVSDLDQASTWYQDILGLKLAYKNSKSGFAEFDVGGTRIALRTVAPFGNGANPMLSLYTYRLEKTVASLKTKGVKFLDDGQVQAEFYGRQIRMQDPDGNIITLFEAND